jgi:prepilin-type processing-associated H-X9-DG protein
MMRKPEDVCRRRLEHLAFALRMWSEDWDNRLPTVQTPSQLRDYLSSYVLGTSPAHTYELDEESDRQGPIFSCPVTGEPYQLVPEVSGLEVGPNFSQVPDPAAVRVLQDARPHPDGGRTVAYLDGHVDQEKPSSEPHP